MESVYMDYNATTPLAPEVMECMREALQYSWANPSSQYQQGKEAKEEIQKARASVAALIGTVNPEDIIFTSGGTEVKYLSSC
jgi:cysteine sulfinate desulfinase/cysteine desulfurase-like protein